MNSQDLRNLQEAYLGVYGDFDESRGDDLRTKHGLKPGEVSARLSKRAEREAIDIGGRTHFDRERSSPLLRLSGLSKVRSKGETPAGDSRRNSKGQLRDIRSRGGRPSNRYDAGTGRDIGDKGERFADFVSGKRDNPNMTDSERRFAHHNRYADPYAVRDEQVDLYDIILPHLLDEVLDTPERATEYGKKALGSILGATVKGLITKDKKYANTVGKRLEGVERAKRKAERKAAEEMKEGKVPWNDPKKPLESGHTPAEKNRAKRERTGVEDLSKSPTDKEYARYGDMKFVDDEQSSASKKNKSTHKFSDFPIDNKGKKQTVGQFRRTRGIPKPESRDEKSNLYQSPIHKDDKRTRGGRLDQWKGPNPRNEETDLYDIILSHLLDEGYADTEKAAERIMVNMSEGWMRSIVG